MTAHSRKMVAVLISKEDFFGKDLLNPSTDHLPETICVCEPCFFGTLSLANRAQWRALNAGREIVLIDSASTDSRPPRCHICSRHLLYSDPEPKPQTIRPQEVTP